MAVVAHASMLVLPFVPGFNVVLVFLVWSAYRQRSPFVREHAVEALNFSVLWTVVYVAVRYLMDPPGGPVLTILLEIFLFVSSIRVALYVLKQQVVHYIPRFQLVR